MVLIAVNIKMSIFDISIAVANDCYRNFLDRMFLFYDPNKASKLEEKFVLIQDLD